jgi:L-2-hydroxyglutarate oxidase LhgO
MSTAADIVICGSGIIGLTLARQLASEGRRDILVIDKEPAIGAHASGRNSGVLHAGVYYDPGTMKAKACQAGNRLMKAYCREHNLPLNENRKVIVARNEAEWPALDMLFERAKANGANVEMIDEDDLAHAEPLARTTGKAMLSHDTAVVDPKAILAQLEEDCRQSGAIRFDLCAGFEKRESNTSVRTSNGVVEYRWFINTAGAWSDRIAHAFDIGRDYKMLPFKGTYRELIGPKADLVRGSIYPVPDIRNPFLGVHFTRGIHGKVGLGPTAIPAFGRAHYGALEGVDSEAFSILFRDAVLFVTNPKFRRVAMTEPRKYLSRCFYEDARQLVKELEPRDIGPSPKCGVRPQLVNWKTRELVMDFMVENGENSTHVLNAISPAFTCSMDIAKKLSPMIPG